MVHIMARMRAQHAQAMPDEPALKSPRHIPYQISPDTNRLHYYENWWKQVALDLLLRHEPSYGREGRSVLDYGCGRGETLEIFGRAGFKVSGTDTDAECVRLAGRHGAACLLDPADPVGQFGGKSHDVVTCFHVLEHVPNPKETLTALAGIARHYVLLAVPNLRYLHRMFERRFDLDQVNEGHLQSWDHWHLRNLAERHCGLEWVVWGSDATILPVISGLLDRVCGARVTRGLEKGLFRRLFPYHCISVIGLFRVPATFS